MPPGIEFPPEKRAEILALLGQGRTLREIEQATGVDTQTIYGWRDRHEQFRLDYDAAKSIYRRYRLELAEARRDWVADELYLQLDDLDGDKRTTLLLRLHELHEKQVQKFEITGDGGGPVAIQHEQRLTLAHLYAFARAVPGFSDADIGELPDARPVLPALENGGAAAGALSPGPES